MTKKASLAIARERIEILMDLSMQHKDSSAEESMREIDIMESIARRTDTTLPAYIKRSYCKGCKKPYGKDTRVRTKRGKILLVTCGNCGDRRHIPYSR